MSIESNGKQSTNQTAARSCHVMKWDNFDGYGFNLHAEKGKPGQYIGKVDEGSPAESAGLRQGDKILEVNGIPIGDKTHKQVVELIKSRQNDTTMLVVDPNCPTQSQATSVTSDNSTSKNGNSNGAALVQDHTTDTTDTTNVTNGNGTVPIINDDNSDKSEKSSENGATSNSTADNSTGMLNLKNMTAAELRANLANRKKYDPKKEMMDFKKKFDIVQKLWDVNMLHAAPLQI